MRSQLLRTTRQQDGVVSTRSTVIAFARSRRVAPRRVNRRRKEPKEEELSPEELLRELNNGGSVLEAFGDADDFSMDDVSAYAQQEREEQGGRWVPGQPVSQASWHGEGLQAEDMALEPALLDPALAQRSRSLPAQMRKQGRQVLVDGQPAAGNRSQQRAALMAEAAASAAAEAAAEEEGEEQEEELSEADVAYNSRFSNDDGLAGLMADFGITDEQEDGTPGSSNTSSSSAAGSSSQDRSAAVAGGKAAPRRILSGATAAGSSRPEAVQSASPAASGTQQKARRKQQQAAAVQQRGYSIREDFDPAVWAAAAPAITGPSSSPAGSSSPGSSPAGSGWLDGSDDGDQLELELGSSRAPEQDIRKQLTSFGAPGQLLAFLDETFPTWANNGCRLVHMGSGGQVEAPTPAEAAYALKGVGLAAKRAGLSQAACMGLARDRHVLGLVEALRVTPPRLLPEQDQRISLAMWQAAKAYWLQGAPAPIEQPPAGSTAGAQGAAQKGAAAASAAASAVLQDLARSAVSPEELQELQQMSAQAGTSGRPAAGGSSSDVLRPALVATPQGQLALAELQRQAALQEASFQAEREQARFEVQEQVKSKAFAAAIWGLSVIGGPAFFSQEMDALLKIARLGYWRFEAGEVSDVMWALANARHWTPRLPEVEQGLLKAGGLTAYKPQEVAAILWGFATLGYTPLRLLYTARKDWGFKRSRGRSGQGAKSFGSIKDFQPGQLASLAWSLAVMKRTSSAPFKTVWEEICRRGPAMTKHANVLVMVWQAAMAMRLEGGREPAAAVPGDVTNKLLQVAERTFLAETSALRKKVHSSYQRAIANSLTGMKIMHMLEDNSTGYAIDITIPSMRLAVEADGPTHMARNDPRRMLGATAMKRRHLRLLGWQVVNISFKQWAQLQSSAAKAAFLQKAIDAAVQAQVQQPQTAAAQAEP